MVHPAYLRCIDPSAEVTGSVQMLYTTIEFCLNKFSDLHRCYELTLSGHGQTMNHRVNCLGICTESIKADNVDLRYIDPIATN